MRKDEITAGDGRKRHLDRHAVAKFAATRLHQGTRPRNRVRANDDPKRRHVLEDASGMTDIHEPIRLFASESVRWAALPLRERVVERLGDALYALDDVRDMCREEFGAAQQLDGVETSIETLFADINMLMKTICDLTMRTNVSSYGGWRRLTCRPVIHPPQPNRAGTWIETRTESTLSTSGLPHERLRAPATTSSTRIHPGTCMRF